MVAQSTACSQVETSLGKPVAWGARTCVEKCSLTDNTEGMERSNPYMVLIPCVFIIFTWEYFFELVLIMLLLNLWCFMMLLMRIYGECEQIYSCYDTVK